MRIRNKLKTSVLGVLSVSWWPLTAGLALFVVAWLRFAWVASSAANPIWPAIGWAIGLTLPAIGLICYGLCPYLGDDGRPI